MVHRDFVEEAWSELNVVVHIGTKESHIARDLVKRNIMKKAACVNVQDFSTQYFWKASETKEHNTDEIATYAASSVYSFLFHKGRSFTPVFCNQLDVTDISRKLAVSLKSDLCSLLGAQSPAFKAVIAIKEHEQCFFLQKTKRPY